MKILIVAVIILVLAGGAYYYMTQSNVSPVPQQNTETPSGSTDISDTQKSEVLKTESGIARVTFKDFAVSPQMLKIKAGTKVIWTNEDLAGHTVTSDTNAFTSKVLGQGKSFEQVFATKGSFPYHCEPHPSIKGTIVVE